MMTREDKLEAISDILEEDIQEDRVLAEFDTWDSIAILSVVALISEETGEFPRASEIKSFQTVSDIMNALGE